MIPIWQMGHPHSDHHLVSILVVEDEFILGQEIKSLLEQLGYRTLGIAQNVQEARGFLDLHQPDLVLLDISIGGIATAGIDFAHELRMRYKVPFIFVSSHFAREIVEKARSTFAYGYLLKPVNKKDLYVAIEIALSKFQYEDVLRLEQEKTLQLSIIDVLNFKSAWDEKFTEIARQLRAFIPFDVIAFTFDTPLFPTRAFSVQQTGLHQFQAIDEKNILKLAGLNTATWAQLFDEINCKEAIFYNEAAFDAYKRTYGLVRTMAQIFRLASAMTIPFSLDREGKFFITFYSRHPETYLPYHLELMQRLNASFSLSLEKQLAYLEIEQLSQKLQQENEHLQAEIEQKYNFSEIIGESPAIREVFEKIKMVAPTDTTVLILGETGTGKELIARAIHKNSRRSKGTLIKVNCAALPANLIESELFGHEKGAFTGALSQRKGKFEVANGGTIFLDEIGEMPMEAQAKLLRVIQERVVERVGGNQEIKVDVRIIAATNRKLGEAITKGNFREDLYFRLNVFPILLPSLRERREDVPLLARHFIQKMSRKLGKRIEALSPNALVNLQQYNFPGNIRELEHIIERAAIEAKSNLLEIHLPTTPTPQLLETSPVFPLLTLEDCERQLILRTLEHTNGRIRGTDGAAELLDIKPTTLEARMKKLGITKKIVTLVQE